MSVAMGPTVGHIQGNSVVQPCGGMSMTGVYGTLTTKSIGDVFCELINQGLTQDDFLCDIGAGLGG
jgi:hypothetical protein